MRIRVDAQSVRCSPFVAGKQHIFEAGRKFVACFYWDSVPRFSKVAAGVPIDIQRSIDRMVRASWLGHSIYDDPGPGLCLRAEDEQEILRLVLVSRLLYKTTIDAGEIN